MIPDRPLSLHNRRLFRICFLFLLLLSVLFIAQSYVQAGSIGQQEYQQQFSLSWEEREPVVAPRDDITVITTQGPLSRFKRASIVAFAPDGRVLYFNNTHDSYFDVDPSPTGEKTVMYVASVENIQRWDDTKRNVVERVNLTTGEVTRLYSYVTRGKWHDVDRVSDSRLLVADIARDTVFIVNTTTGVREWQWSARTYLSVDPPEVKSGDVTHLNDVEYLADGRVMVSLRNQDQVVFIDPETGVMENWTLGTDDNHSVLFEQHNPDYLPPEEGGPAVVVSDSENNRIVEYQRRNGAWERTWVWQTSRLQWPRDADRLPNGHTLITNSNGDGVFEVNTDGEVVWSADIYLPYEAERVESGDESTGGPAAAASAIDSRDAQTQTGQTDRASSLSEFAWNIASTLIPSRILNGLVFVFPAWMGKGDIIPLGVILTTVVVWGLLEVRWLPYRIDVRWPLRVFREDR